MSMSIKPPDLDPVAPEGVALEEGMALDGAEASAAGPLAEVHQQAGVEEAGLSGPEAGFAAELAQAVQRGELSGSELVERLLQQVVGQHALDGQELRQFLLDALQDDPTLRALRHDVGDDT